jgi:uncharacterized protein YdeI (YjbR/CyaY-like superfamily)
MTAKPELPIVEMAGPAAWREWLEHNHVSSAGVWLKLAKKASPTRTVTHGEALEEALCYGWIDGQAGRYDEHFYLVRFTPRRPRSVWSQINREKAMKLIEEGRMAPAGLAAVDAAKADGRWEQAYAPQSQATVPDDFQRALEASPQAKQFFETLTGSRRYAFLYRLHHVRDEERRAVRIAGYVDLLEKGKTLED